MKLADFEKYVCQLSLELHIGSCIMEGFYIVRNMKVKEIIELKRSLIV
ncbi:hypothetical protein [uncultured Fusobacterium sp.]|jgi:hypothetical protein|nr:hypothetical protein [uncultured Fusobacterium sp.]